jgi:hypothetical protein
MTASERSPRVTSEPATPELFNPSSALREYMAGSGFEGEGLVPRCPPAVVATGLVAASAGLAASRRRSGRSAPVEP